MKRDTKSDECQAELRTLPAKITVNTGLPYLFSRLSPSHKMSCRFGEKVICFMLRRIICFRLYGFSVRTT